MPIFYNWALRCHYPVFSPTENIIVIEAARIRAYPGPVGAVK